MAQSTRVRRRGYTFAQLPDWVLYHPDLNAQAVRLFAVLDRFAGDSDDCFPSRKKMAKRMGCSPSAVDRAMAQLVKVGAVEVTSRRRVGDDEDGGQTSNLYTLQGVDPSVRTDEGGTQNRTGGVVDSDEAPSAESNSQERESDERESLNKPRAAGLAHRSPTFADCWKVYPRKLARLKAEKAWKARIRSGVDAQQLYDATVHYAKHRSGQDGSYTMHGSTFYGPDDRWLDFLAPSTAEPPPSRRTAKQEADDRLLAEVARVNGHRQEISA